MPRFPAGDLRNFNNFINNYTPYPGDVAVFWSGAAASGAKAISDECKTKPSFNDHAGATLALAGAIASGLDVLKGLSNNPIIKHTIKGVAIASLINECDKILESINQGKGISRNAIIDLASAAIALGALSTGNPYVMVTCSVLIIAAQVWSLASDDTTIVSNDELNQIFPFVDKSSTEIDERDPGFKECGGEAVDGVANFAKKITVSFSPIVLNLDHSAIETSEVEYSFNKFDLDAQGLKEKTAWISPNDGFLVVDKNGNGNIDSGSELFGNATSLNTGENAANGFAALAEFDSNQDGVVDAKDAQFALLKIWQDLNSDGISQSHEIKSLIEWGIQTLHVNFDNSNYQSTLGNTHKQQGQFVWADGQLGQMDDVWFASDLTATQAKTIELSEAVKSLPNIVGAGDIANLRISMHNKPELLALVQQFVSDAKTSTDFEHLYEQASLILLSWANQEKTTGYRGYLAAAQVNTVELFTGYDFIQYAGINEGTPNPGPNVSREFATAFKDLSQIIFKSLMGFAVYKPYVEAIQINMNATNTWVVADVSQAIAMLKSQYDLSSAYGLDLLKGFYDQVSGLGLVSEPIIQAMRQAGDFNGDAFAQALAGFGFDSTVFGTVAADNLTGTTGDDQILADAGDDVLIGDEGDDVLVGGAGNDTIRAGLGNDEIYAGAGNDLILNTRDNDRIHWGIGSGKDTVDFTYDQNGTITLDTLVLGAGITPQNLKLSESGIDLLLSIDGNSNDHMLLKAVFENINMLKPEGTVQLQFAEGSMWTIVEIMKALYPATIGHDVIKGSGLAESFDGLAGNDKIDGFQGMDTLWGNDGNDRLWGGDGQDLIYGGNGDDQLLGEEGDDTIDGGAGDDEINDLLGSNNLIFGTGSGHDHINAKGSDRDNLIDQIVLSADINPLNLGLRFTQSQKYGGLYDLVISIAGNPNDSLSIRDFFDGSIDKQQAAFSLKFADGSIWGLTELLNHAYRNRDGEDYNLAGDSLGNVIQAGSGNNIIFGFDGADSIVAGAGNDQINSNSNSSGSDDGVDTIDAGMGNDSIFHTDHQSGVNYVGDVIQFNLKSANDSSGQTNHDVISNSSYQIDYDVNKPVSALQDRIMLGQGIDPSITQISLNAAGDLRISFVGHPDDSILVKGYLDAYQKTSAYIYGQIGMVQLHFTDGTVWNGPEIFKQMGMSADGNANIIVMHDDQTAINGLAGNDTISGSLGDDRIDGGLGDDVIEAGTGNNSIQGGAGNDEITVLQGNSTVDGQTGNDFIDLGLGRHVVHFGLGSGSDTIRSYQASRKTILPSELNHTAIHFAAGLVVSDVQMSLDTAGNLILEVGAAGDRLQVSDFASNHDLSFYLDNPTTALSLHFTDSVGVTSEFSTLDIFKQLAQQGAIPAIVMGGDGNDALESSTGDGSNSGVNNDYRMVIAGSGDDTITARSSMPNTVSTQFNQDGAIVYGEAGNDVIIGSKDWEILDGGSGNDTLMGGLGSDNYIIDSSLDVVVELDNEGTDRISSWIDFDLSKLAHVENLSLLGNAIYATGNAGNNYIEGNAQNNQIAGGDGKDEMVGGQGDDLYWVSGDDSITEYRNEGQDTIVVSGQSFTLANHIEELNNASSVGSSLTGNSLNNVIRGNAGQDTITGHSGADTLIGGAGNDEYWADSSDTLIESADAGVDWVRSYTSHNLAANIEHLTLEGEQHGNAQGNELNNVVLGNSGNNLIQGMAGNDTLNMYAGPITYKNSVIEAATKHRGRDTIEGGAGDDAIYVWDSNDTVIEHANEGQDTVFTIDNHSLSAHVENLVAFVDVSYELSNNWNVGARGITSLVGNDLDNRIVGIAGASIDGGAGADTMETGGTFIVDHVGDVVISASHDAVVKSSVTYSTSQDIQQVHLTGNTAINATSSRSDGVLMGNKASNVLTGLTGTEFNGGAGDDWLIVQSVSSASRGSLFSFSQGFGHDTIELQAQNSVASSSLQLGKIVFEDSIHLADIVYSKSGQDLWLKHKNGADDLLIKNAFDAQGQLVTEQSIYFSSDSIQIDNRQIMDLLRWSNGSIDAQHQVSQSFSSIGNNSKTLNDSLVGTDSNDVLLAYDGSDTLDGAAGDDTLSMTDGNAVITGGAGNDWIIANSGNQTITGASGDDSLDGGAGQDLYLFSNYFGHDVIKGRAGVGSIIRFDRLVVSADLVFAVDAADLLISNSVTQDQLRISNYFSSSTGLTNNLAISNIQMGDGRSLGFTAVKDLITNLNGKLPEQVDGTGFNDSLIGGFYDDTLSGLAGHDFVKGGAGDDSLNGNDGNDTLDGGGGADTVIGGLGNDVYVISDHRDSIVELANQGEDSIHTSIDLTMIDHIEHLLMTGVDDVSVQGNAAANRIEGNSGRNVIDGGAGIDTMTGGANDDTYTVDHANDLVSEAKDEGFDTIRSWLNYILPVYSLFSIESLEIMGAATEATGNEAANLITGNDNNNLIKGMAGSDTLIGGVGIDTLVGGTGDDYYYLETPDDIVLELAGEGNDTLDASFNVDSLDAQIENIVLFENVLAIRATGHAGNNVIRGNAQDNVINGGAGVDTLIGGMGNDLYWVDQSNDLIQEEQAQGNDTVHSSVNYQLGYQVENLVLEIGATTAIQARGNGSNNILQGNEFNNSLWGGLGNDTLIGGLGDDTIDGGDGLDVVSFASETAAIYADLNTQQFNTSGLDQIINVEGVVGGSGNDSMIGTSGDNILIGGIGVDTLIGGAGNDLYDFDNPSDVIIELTAEGMDTVRTQIDYVMGQHIEVVQSTAKLGESIVITGNELDNLLIAANGNEQLDGASGQDTVSYQFAGGSVVVDLSSTQVQNTGFSGTDQLQNIEHIIASHYNDTLMGNAVNNVINGGAGIDQVSYLGSSAAILVNLGSGTASGAAIGQDQLIAIENLNASHFDDSVTGSAADNELIGLNGNDQLFGEAGQDQLYGGDGNDWLSGGLDQDDLFGGAGLDTLIGGSGADLLDGNEGADTMIYNRGDGNDVIYGQRRGGDELHLGADIAATDVSFERGTDSQINDLIVVIKTAAGLIDSRITVVNQYGVLSGDAAAQSTGLSRLVLADQSIVDIPNGLNGQSIAQVAQGNGMGWGAWKNAVAPDAFDNLVAVPFTDLGQAIYQNTDNSLVKIVI